ncbi:MAG: hypothetical protein M3Z31_17365 [Pseudomonadota bacterium]|nr:hypothetical protein [Pseudomonadota bacterium]
MTPIAAELTGFSDPRTFGDRTPPPNAAQWYELAGASLEAEHAMHRDVAEADLRRSLAEALVASASSVQAAIESAPSPYIARHLWRAVDAMWREAPDAHDVGVTPFALPVVIVAGAPASAAGASLSGMLREPQRVVDVLRSGAALHSNQTFAVHDAMVSPSALAIAAWPAWQPMRSAGLSLDAAARTLFAPARIEVAPGSEAAHLRFIIGSAVAPRHIDVLASRSVGTWGRPLAIELTRQLAEPDMSLLALPRAPHQPFSAHLEGILAQREVSAQLFASNAVRRLRSSTGEPTAVISSHRCAAAAGGGELRLSLSSPFETRDAEGFRCPILAIEPVTAPLRMLLDLLQDCRITDVRLLAGVHPDRIPGSTAPLMFKPETIPEGALLQ